MNFSTLRARLDFRRIACLLAVLLVVPVRAAEKMDEFTQAVARYELTLPKLNPKNTAFVRAHEARVGEILKQATADRARAFGR